MKLTKQIAKLCLLSTLLITASCSKDKKSSYEQISNKEVKAEVSKEVEQALAQEEKASEVEDKAQALAQDLMYQQQIVMENIQAELTEKINLMMEEKLEKINNIDPIEDKINSELEVQNLKIQEKMNADLTAKIEARIAKKVSRINEMTPEQMNVEIKSKEMQIKINKDLDAKINADIDTMMKKQSDEIATKLEAKMQELQERRMDAIVTSAIIDKQERGQISIDTQELIAELTVVEAVKNTVKSKQTQAEISKVVNELDSKKYEDDFNITKSLEAKIAKKMEQALCKQTIDCSNK